MKKDLTTLKYGDGCKISNQFEYDIIHKACNIAGVRHETEAVANGYNERVESMAMGGSFLSKHVRIRNEFTFEEMIIKIFKGVPRIAVQVGLDLSNYLDGNKSLSRCYNGIVDQYYTFSGNVMQGRHLECPDNYLLVPIETFKSIYDTLNGVKSTETKEETMKTYEVPYNILSGVSQLTDAQKDQIKAFGIVIDMLNPVATEEQIKHVYSIICPDWKERFKAAFPFLKPSGNAYDAVKDYDGNITLPRRNFGNLTGTGFFLRNDVKWKIETDDVGIQVLIPEHR